MDKFTLHVTEREFHTIIAALRFWQCAFDFTRYPEIDDIATNGGEVVWLDNEEVSALCERINFSDTR